MNTSRLKIQSKVAWRNENAKKLNKNKPKFKKTTAKCSKIFYKKFQCLNCTYKDSFSKNSCSFINTTKTILNPSSFFWKSRIKGQWKSWPSRGLPSTPTPSKWKTEFIFTMNLMNLTSPRLSFSGDSCYYSKGCIIIRWNVPKLFILSSCTLRWATGPSSLTNSATRRRLINRREKRRLTRKICHQRYVRGIKN